MRALLLSDFYPPVLGGLELQVQALARALVARGHSISVATLTLDRPGVFDDQGVTVYRLRGWQRALAPAYRERARPFHPTVPDPGVVAALRRVVALERPQAVLAHSWMVYSYLPLARTAGLRLSLRLHDYGLVCARKTFVHHGAVCAGPGAARCLRCAGEQYRPLAALGLTSGLRIMRTRLAASLAMAIANSSAVAAACAPWLGASALTVVPPWLDDDVFDAPPRPRPAFLPSGDFILFAGALTRNKGLPVLLEAYAGLPAGLRAPLVLAGMPRADTPRRLPPGVRLVERVAHDELLAAWPHCTVAVVPSVWPEPFGLSAVEALAAGRPLIASATGGLRDIVEHGRSGLLVPPGDPGPLRAALARLLADPGERARLGAAGRVAARRYAAAAVVPRMEELIWA